MKIFIIFFILSRPLIHINALFALKIRWKTLVGKTSGGFTGFKLLGAKNQYFSYLFVAGINPVSGLYKIAKGKYGKDCAENPDKTQGLSPMAENSDVWHAIKNEFSFDPIIALKFYRKKYFYSLIKGLFSPNTTFMICPKCNIEMEFGRLNLRSSAYTRVVYSPKKMKKTFTERWLAGSIFDNKLKAGQLEVLRNGWASKRKQRACYHCTRCDTITLPPIEDPILV